jgi:hypothetical protein
VVRRRNVHKRWHPHAPKRHARFYVDISIQERLPSSGNSAGPDWSWRYEIDQPEHRSEIEWSPTEKALLILSPAGSTCVKKSTSRTKPEYERAPESTVIEADGQGSRNLTGTKRHLDI